MNRDILLILVLTCLTLIEHAAESVSDQFAPNTVIVTLKKNWSKEAITSLLNSVQVYVFRTKWTHSVKS